MHWVKGDSEHSNGVENLVVMVTAQLPVQGRTETHQLQTAKAEGLICSHNLWQRVQQSS